MKKPSLKLFKRQLRRQLRVARRNKSANRLGACRQPSEHILKKQLATGQKHHPRKTLIAPVTFDLTRGSGANVISFLEKIERRVIVEKRRVRLNFKSTKSFYVPGALMLYAALSKIIAEATMTKPITIIPPRATLINNAARQVMQQVGLYDLTADRINVRTDREDVIYWKMVTGADQSGDQLAMLETLAEKINKSDKDILASKDLWRGVTEAVNNTSDHAYDYPRSDGFEGLDSVRWWLLTQLRGNTFTAAVCDLGCGYSKTLTPEIGEWFKGVPAKWLGKENEDTLAMQAAMEYGRSRTKLNERGKGSRCALALLEKHGSGELYLLSNAGCLHYECVKNVVTLKQVITLAFDIKGTIIWWNLHLGDA